MNGKQQTIHVALAERALGKPLPYDAVVHHVDENPYNNEPSNLVICPNSAYHRLLHKRKEALEACGDPTFRWCLYCRVWDSPKNLTKQASYKETYFHDSCRREYRRQKGG